MTTFATRAFNFRDEAGTDHTVAKGSDLSKRKPALTEQQIEDFRHAGLVGAKPDDASKDADSGTAAKPKA